MILFSIFLQHDSSVKELMRALPDFPLIEKWEKKILLKVDAALLNFSLFICYIYIFLIVAVYV